jgi:hypothetical protein
MDVFCERLTEYGACQMANEKNGIDLKKAAAIKVEATLVGNIKAPLLQDHIRNLFEKTRAGTPVVRPDDLVALRIETRNLEIVPGRSALPINGDG